jgi:hypothetical protein
MSVKLMPNVSTVQVCSMKTMAVKTGFDAKKLVVGTHILCELSETGLFVCVCVCVCVCARACVYVCVCVWRAQEIRDSCMLLSLNFTKKINSVIFFDCCFPNGLFLISLPTQLLCISFLIVVFPCMLMNTKSGFQINALVSLLKYKITVLHSCLEFSKPLHVSTHVGHLQGNNVRA